MFTSVSGLLLQNFAIYTKIIFVILLLLNSYFIHKHYSIAVTQKSNNLTKKENNKLLLFGLISTFSWVVVLISSQFLGL